MNKTNMISQTENTWMKSINNSGSYISQNKWKCNEFSDKRENRKNKPTKNKTLIC